MNCAKNMTKRRFHITYHNKNLALDAKSFYSFYMYYYTINLKFLIRFTEMHLICFEGVQLYGVVKIAWINTNTMLYKEYFEGQDHTM